VSVVSWLTWVQRGMMRVIVDLVEDLTRRYVPLNLDITSSEVWEVGMVKFDQEMSTMTK
jgi:hypothetical protein